MKIGDRAFVRGYIDEIRKDTVIIRNAGGYFGTIPSEVITGELPSTQFERKIGQWIFEERKRLVDETDDGAVYRTEKWWSCSECGYTKGYHISKPSSNYCENCGAEMLKEGEG